MISNFLEFIKQGLNPISNLVSKIQISSDNTQLHFVDPLSVIKSFIYNFSI